MPQLIEKKNLLLTKLLIWIKKTKSRNNKADKNEKLYMSKINI